MSFLTKFTLSSHFIVPSFCFLNSVLCKSAAKYLELTCIFTQIGLQTLDKLSQWEEKVCDLLGESALLIVPVILFIIGLKHESCFLKGAFLHCSDLIFEVSFQSLSVEEDSRQCENFHNTTAHKPEINLEKHIEIVIIFCNNFQKWLFSKSVDYESISPV